MDNQETRAEREILYYCLWFQFISYKIPPKTAELWFVTFSFFILPDLILITISLIILYAIGYLFDFVQYITYQLTALLLYIISQTTDSVSQRLETHGIFGRGARIDFGSPVIQKGAALIWFLILSLFLCTPILFEYFLNVSINKIRYDTSVWKLWVFLFTSTYLALQLKSAQFRDYFPGWLGISLLSYLFWTVFVIVVMAFLMIAPRRVGLPWQLLIWAALVAIPTYLWITWIAAIYVPIRDNSAPLKLRNAWMRAVYGLPGTAALLSIIMLHFMGLQLTNCASAADAGADSWQWVALNCAFSDPYWRAVPVVSIVVTLVLAPVLFRLGRKISSLPIRV